MKAAPASPAPPDRRASIDVLRAGAIALMVVVHFVENLSASYAAASPFEGVGGVYWLPTGFSAPIFTLLSGVSYRLWLEDAVHRGRSDESITKTTIRRGLFLLGFGIAFNVCVWLPADVFNWDILTFIGCGLLALELARRMPDGVVWLAVVGIIAIAPTLQRLADHQAFWTEGYFDYDFTLGDVFLGWLVTGYFPVVPWLVFPLAGYVASPWLVGATRGFAALAVSSALIVASVGIQIYWQAMPMWVTGDAARPWMMFPATTAYVLGTLGAASLVLTLAHRLLDGDPSRCRWLVDWAGPLSRRSLTLYVVHHIVHVWPLWIAGLATTDDVDSLWKRALPASWSFGLAIAFLLAAAALCRRAERLRMPSLERFMRWICD